MKNNVVSVVQRKMYTMRLSYKALLRYFLPEFIIKRIKALLFVISKNRLPGRVRLEASTLCQLNCKSCYMRKLNFGTMGTGYLKFSDFKNFIQNNKFVKNIELSNNGEIFLNPDLLHILEYAFENNVTLSANNGVNFNTVSDEIAEALVKYRFNTMAISIDGASQEIYSLYRINGDFNTVMKNIIKVNKYKQKYKSQFPELTWHYVIMEHNECDIVKAKEMAKELQMKIKFKLTWDIDCRPKNVTIIRKETGLDLNCEDVFENDGIVYPSICRQLWSSPQINWDGRLLGCCCAYTEDFGVNVFETGLKEAIKTENYKYAKKMLEGKIDIQKNMKNIPCVNCSKYKTMKATGKYI
jgi:MoaA/NifB/PqqE/SkfB family radical SAM enzyme